MSDDCRFNDNDWCVVHGTPLNRGRRSNYCSLKSELSLNEFQRQMHTYKMAHEECHALGIVGELAEVVEELTEVTGPLVTHGLSAEYRERIVNAFLAAGRVTDMVKKAASHSVPADRAKLVKELGDLMWYIGAVARDNDITLEEVAQANIAKLRERYPNGFEKGGGVREPLPAGGCSMEPVRNFTDTAPAGEIPAVLCEHANECPSICRCPVNCYCRRVGSAPSCKPRRNTPSNRVLDGDGSKREQDRAYREGRQQPDAILQEDISLVGGVPVRTHAVYFHCGCSEVNGRKTRCADALCERLKG